MPFELVQRLTVGIVAAAGVASLLVNGQVATWVAPATAFAIVASLLPARTIGARVLRHRHVSKVMVFAAIAVVTALRLARVELAPTYGCMLQIVLLATARTASDSTISLWLAYANFTGSTLLLPVDDSFPEFNATPIFVGIVVAPAALSFTFLRAEIEARYPLATRDSGEFRSRRVLGPGFLPASLAAGAFVACFAFALAFITVDHHKRVWLALRAGSAPAPLAALGFLFAGLAIVLSRNRHGPVAPERDPGTGVYRQAPEFERRDASPAAVTNRASLTRVGKYLIGISLWPALWGYNTHRPCTMLLAGALLGLMLVALVAGRVQLLGLSVDRLLPRGAFVDTEFLVELTIRNGSRRSSAFAIDLRDEGLSTQKPCYFLRASPQSSRTVKRGETLFVPGPMRYHGIRITSRFPFGWFETSRFQPLPATLHADDAPG